MTYLIPALTLMFLAVLIWLKRRTPKLEGRSWYRPNVKVSGRWVEAGIVKRNRLTRWYRLPDGHVVKRKAGRDYAAGTGLYS